MKIYITILTLFSFIHLQSQDGPIPQSYLDDLSYEIGTWIGDNSSYQSEHEKFDSYVIEWSWGIGKKSITGKLYGMSNGKPSTPFWEFRKYWNAKENKAIVMQFGQDGTLGIGPVESSDDQMHEMKQVFVTPKGKEYHIGHKTQIVDSTTQIGSSYLIDENGNWSLDRTYKWIKQPAN